MTYSIQKPDKALLGTIRLDGSKSISNRALIIRALAQQSFLIHHISTSKDTQTLELLLNQLVQQPEGTTPTLDTGHAGTTFRFLTGYLAFAKGTQILTGSERMQQRPIGILVDALRKLGADIEYLKKEGFPPLQISERKAVTNYQLSIPANTSSQYISSLLMLGPTLPDGLELTLEGKIVSVPYIRMTLELMKYFGIDHQWKDNVITIKHQPYQAKDFTVEADWSAASYYYALAALANDVNFHLHGLSENSTQGDAVIADMMKVFGIHTSFDDKGIHLQKNGVPIPPMFEYDFLECPDIAQTLAVICGGLGVTGLFTGLDTLSIKETDRVAALQNELAKVQVFFSRLPPKFSKKSDKTYYMLEGRAKVDHPVFATYEDHRMAMAFAPLALLGSIQIEHPQVVRKSYPGFWEDLKLIGFDITSFQ